MDTVLHVLGVVVLVLEGICATMGIVYYALKFSDRIYYTARLGILLA